MLCEMCGKDTLATRIMLVEGTRLNLCQNCAKFGDEYKSTGKDNPGEPVSHAVIEQRLQKREKRMQTRDMFSGATVKELVEEYGEVIRKARESKGMTIDSFAESIFEKRGTIAKIESNNLIPDDKIILKIEKALDVQLREEVQSGAGIKRGNNTGSMTLSNFIRKE